MRGIYTLGNRFYKLIVALASLFNPKAKKWIQGRKESWIQLNSVEWKEGVIWFHCASLGEFEQGRPIIERLKAKNSSTQILVTFFSPSGYEIRKNYELADCICYLPIDTRKNAKKLYELVPIKTAYFIKYEFWGNYIIEANKLSIELNSISTLLRPGQIFFKPWGGFFRKILSKIHHFYVQNEETKQLLANIGLKNSTIVGDTRFDRVSDNAAKVEANDILDSFKTKRMLTIGSSWPADEQILFDIINSEAFTDLVLLAPHEIDAGHIQQIEKGISKPYQLYTDLEKGEVLNPQTQVIILNCIGLLANAYQYGDYAYVGGGFGTGLHNILEPCVFGLPVAFGPIHKKFPEAQKFINASIGIEISTSEDIQKAFTSFTEDLDKYSAKCKAFVATNVGATDLVLGN
jgi:3-deoxy-D-manno-octulosonic-acid transferase